MATLATNYLTLADLYRRRDPDNSIADVIELMNQVNPVLSDTVAVECNNGVSHLTTIRTGVPSATWRKLYQGVQPTKSTTAQVEDTTGMLEAWSEVDAKLVKLSNDPAAFRLSEAKAFIEGLSQQGASAIFYEDVLTTPERMLGLRARFNDTAGGTITTGPGAQIVRGTGGSGSSASIWFIVWGADTCHLLYPKGTMAGIQRNEIGEETKDLGASGVYRVFREQFTWDLGLSVRDWRYIARVANLNVAQLIAASGADFTNLITMMIQAYYKLWQRPARMPKGGGLAIYCNRDVKTALHLKARNDITNSTLSFANFEGKEILTFMGAPIREIDALVSTETLAS